MIEVDAKPQQYRQNRNPTNETLCQITSTMSNYIDGVKLHRPCQITTTSCDELHRLRTAENTFTCSRHLLTKKHHAFETCYKIVFQNEKLRTPRRVELE